MIGDTAEPTNGVPSLTPSEIITLYLKYFRREPDSTEMASEQANALKYSAAGIERQIANRAGNAPGTGVRGDEGLAPLTIPAPVIIPDSHAGNVLTMGPAAIVPNGSYAPSGPTGLSPGYYGGPVYPGGVPATQPAPTIFGLSPTLFLLVLAAAGASIYFLMRK